MSYSRIGRPGDADWMEPEPAGRQEAAASGHAAESRGRDEALVRAVLIEMSPADHDVLQLAYGQGFGAAEIAMTLGISVRRAQDLLQSATSRFEARSMAVALTSYTQIDCPELAELVPEPSAGDAGLPDRHCKRVTEHASSCPVCADVVAHWNIGSELFGILATLIQSQPTSATPIEPYQDRPGRFWERSPVLVVASTAAVLVIAVGALGVNKLVGDHTVNTAAPPPASSRSSRAGPPAQNAGPAPSPASSPQASPSATVAPAAPKPGTKSTSAAPKPSPSSSPPPSSPPPSPSSSSSSPPPSPSTSPSESPST